MKCSVLMASVFSIIIYLETVYDKYIFDGVRDFIV